MKEENRIESCEDCKTKLLISVDSITKMREEKEFCNDKLHGISKEFFDNGQISVIAHFNYNKKEGEFAKYNREGVLIEKSNWLEDVENGSAEFYYDNGNKKIITNFYNGVQIGDFESYFIKGNIHLKYYLDSNGNKSGEYEEYYVNGMLKEKSNWKNGVPINVVKYHNNGNIGVMGVFKKGKQNVEYKFFDKNGIYSHSSFYQDGIKIK
jgi:antitoxin component YwqK of YwqJK toxin-antitoxin module